MPSLCSIPDGESGEAAQTKKSGENDAKETTTGESIDEDTDPTPTKESSPDTLVSLPSDEPLETSVSIDANGPEEMTTSEAESSKTTPNSSKKRRLTPTDDSGSKKKQQKKVNQMILSSFFNKANASTPSHTGNKRKKTSTGATPTPTNESLSDAVASGSLPRKTTLLTNAKSSPTVIPKNNKTEVEIIDLDSDDDQVQAKSTTPTKNSCEKISSSAVGDSNLSSDNEKTGTVDSRDLATENKAIEDKTDSSVNTLDASVGAKTVAMTFSSSTNTASVPESKSSNINPATGSLAPATPATSKRKRRSKSKTPEPSAATTPSASAVKKTLTEEDLTEELRETVRKYKSTKGMYLKRANEVVGRHRNGLEEENLGTLDLEPITDGTELKTNETNLCEDFPTQVMANMALLIEGSDLPLSQLVSKVCSELKDAHGVEWSEELVGAKIKLLSKRKAYLDPTKKSTKVVDLFEDDVKDRLWRWEVTTLDLLASDFTSKARKARGARKKVSSHHSALLKLVKSLEEIEKLILDPELPELNNAKAKVSRDEEKVLKFERDAEKQRLADEVKTRKLLEHEAKKKAKEEALEAKKLAKEQALEAKKRKKQEAVKAREDEKRKREEEKSRKEGEKKLEEKKKLETVTKQKASFRSFFAAPKKVANDQKKNAPNNCIDLTCDSFDVESFRAKINASDDVLDFSLKENKRSTSAIKCRKRRTKTVSVSVYKTVEADSSEWGASDYLEQTTIKVPNKYRFRSFHEDCRPPYHGTWSKTSSIVTGKTPLGKDTAAIDYDYDTEAEWEEGDDEMGENVDDDSKNGEDEADIEGNAKVYDFEDGFCVADDQLLDNEEDADEDTKALYKKKMQSREQEEQQHLHSNRVRIIAPGFGGVPLHLKGKDSMSTDCVEGFDIEKAIGVISSYKGIQLSNAKLCVDAFPQLHMHQENRSETNVNGDTNKDDYSPEAMVVLARFAHHSTLSSKDKVIEELRTSSSTLFSNRAKATRKLDAIAVKKKHPKYAGVYWEVKSQILTELGLTDIMEKKVQDIVYEENILEKSVSSGGDQKSKKISRGKDQSPNATKNSKANDEKAETPGSGSKKRKVAKAKTPELTNSAKKKKLNEGRGSGKKDNPKNKDACPGMKSVMAQFVKRTPAKTTASSAKGATSSSTEPSR